MIALGPKQSVASIDVDVQKGFTPLCPDELPIVDAHTIAKALNDQAKLAQYRIGSKDAHPANAVWVTENRNEIMAPISNLEYTDCKWPKHCVPGTKGFELIDGLPHPAEYDFFVYKGIEPDMHPYGACYHDLKEQQSTGLIEFLRAHHIQTVIVGGLATDFCVKVTVCQLLKAGFRTIVNLGACKGITQESSQKAVLEMESQGAIMIKSLNELKHETSL